MTRSDVVKVYVALQALWPPRLVDPLTEAAAAAVASAMPPAATLEHALDVVNDFFRRGSPFPPSWPEIAQRWQARAAGVKDDHDLIANAWLAEVYAEVGRSGGTFYRPMPEFTDPIIGAAVRSAAGSWRDWGLTPNGGTGAEGEAFTRNLIPERDKRFRQAVKAMLAHRTQTGESVPEIVSRRPGELGPGSSLELPDLSMERKADDD